MNDDDPVQIAQSLAMSPQITNSMRLHLIELLHELVEFRARSPRCRPVGPLPREHGFMPAKIDYALSNYREARNILANGTAGNRERLLDAYLGRARLAHPVVPGQVTQELRDRIETLHSALTSESPVGTEGAIKATVSNLDEPSVEWAIGEIVEIAKSLEAEFEEQQATRL